MEIDLKSLRTITSVDVDGRETKCDDNPTEELRRQFGELQKSLKALNHYTRYVNHFYYICIGV
jgi:hypothetical protein